MSRREDEERAKQFTLRSSISQCFYVRSHRIQVGPDEIGSILKTERTIAFVEGVSQSASRMACSYLWSTLIWLALAPVDALEDQIGLLDRGLHAPYRILLLIQGAWLLTAALLTPPIFSFVRRYPITGEHRVGRVAGYLFGSLPYLAASACIRSALLPPWDFAAHQFNHRTVKALLSNIHSFGFQLWCYLAILVAAHAYGKRLQRAQHEFGESRRVPNDSCYCCVYKRQKTTPKPF